MKRFLGLLVVWLCMTGSCLALQPVDNPSLQQAVNYGIDRSDTLKFSDAAFLAPWTINDSALKNPYRLSEKVVVYSPYLLAALQAKSIYRAKGTPTVQGIREFLTDYEGITVVGAVLNTPLQLTKEDFDIKLRQGTVVLAPYAVELLKFRYLDNKAAVVQAKKRADALYLEKLKQKSQALKNELAALKNDKTAGGTAAATEPEKDVRVPLTKIGESTMQLYFDNRAFNPQMPYDLVISDQYSESRIFKVYPSSIK